MSRSILHCDMNNFYASVECMLDPTLKKYPVAVCGSVEERHGIVLAKNYAAKAFGVATGDAVWQAKQKCKDLVIVPPHYEEYIKYSKLARSVYSRFTDQVEPYGMDECWLDISGTEKLYGSPERVANEIKEIIKFELGLTISVGVSFNKIFAKLGSDMKKPDATVSKELYNYNSFGNLEKEIIEEYTYVLNSNTNEYDEVLNTIETTYAYDIWNQQINITVKKTGEADLTTVITYDELGNTSTVTEDGVTVAYTYSNGNVSTVTETKELQQDNGTKVTKTVISDYGYSDGNLVSRTNTTKVDEAVTETTVASYGYDKYGNLTYHEFNGYAFTYNTLGNILTAKAAVKKDENGNETSVDIVSYTYSPDIKQDVEFSSFGNNQIIDYEYNSNGEIIAIKLGADVKYAYEYSPEKQTASEGETSTETEDPLTKNLDGEWVKINDKVSGLFKVIQENKTSVYDSDKAFVYSVETSSKDDDDANSFDGTVTTIGANVYTLVTEENEDTFKTNDSVDFSKKYVYNEEESELERTLTSNVFYTDYGYGENGVKVLENVFEKNDNGEITEGYVFNYGYENENISSETLTVKSKAEDGSSGGYTESVSYEYDDNDQLVKADYGDVLYEYVYDYSDDESIEYECRGNITKKTITDGGVSQTVVYEYDDVWKDKLISYNGQLITYDAVGNPTNYMGNALTWTMGRQLASFGNVSYTYNEDGIRTSKTSNGVTTKFLLDGYNVIEQTDGTTTLHFFYDSNGEVIGFRYNGNDYFYVKNAMSDIIAITDSNKNIVAEYRYDPWGKVLGEEDLTTIGNLNPFRYRSYYYDNDIKMYYLQSRYYDAEVGRFINCDDVNYIGVTESEVSYNPFAYCENNPTNDVDPTGHLSLKSLKQALEKAINTIKKWASTIWEKIKTKSKDFLRIIKYEKGELSISAIAASLIFDAVISACSKTTASAMSAFGFTLNIAKKFAKSKLENFFKKQMVPYITRGYVNTFLTNVRKIFWKFVSKSTNAALEYATAYTTDKIYGRFDGYDIVSMFTSWGSFISVMLDVIDGDEDDYITIRRA